MSRNLLLSTCVIVASMLTSVCGSIQAGASHAQLYILSVSTCVSAQPLGTCVQAARPLSRARFYLSSSTCTPSLHFDEMSLYLIGNLHATTFPVVKQNYNFNFFLAQIPGAQATPFTVGTPAPTTSRICGRVFSGTNAQTNDMAYAAMTQESVCSQRVSNLRRCVAVSEGEDEYVNWTR